MSSWLIKHVVRQNNWSWCKQWMLHLSLLPQFPPQHLHIVSWRKQERLSKSCAWDQHFMFPVPKSPWDSLLPQHPKTHSTPAAPASCIPSLQFKCNPQSNCCLARLEDFQPPRNQAFICSVFFEWHCPTELLKWWGILAVQTSTFLNCSDCNCRTCFKLLINLNLNSCSWLVPTVSISQR